MSDQLGRNVAVGYQKETTRGTAITSALRWVGKLDFDFFDRADTIVNESGYGHIAKDSRVDILRRYGQGGMTTKIFDKAVGDILTMIFGQAPTTANVSGDTTVKDHTFTLLNNNSHVSYTIATKEGDIQSLVYPGAVINEATIDIVVDDYAKIAASFLSKKSEAPGGTLTPAYTEENEFTPKHASVKVAAYGADLAAASVTADVTEAHLTISKNAIPRPSIGNDSVDPRNTVMEVTGELTLYYNSTTFKAYRDNQTKLAMRIQVANTDVTIGTSSNPTLTIDLPYVRVENWEPDYSNDDLITQTLSIRALLDLSTGTLMTAKVRNLQASY